VYVFPFTTVATVAIANFNPFLVLNVECFGAVELFDSNMQKLFPCHN